MAWPPRARSTTLKWRGKGSDIALVFPIRLLKGRLVVVPRNFRAFADAKVEFVVNLLAVGAPFARVFEDEGFVEV